MNRVVVTLEGDIDLESQEDVLAALDDAVERAREDDLDVVVDMRGVTFLDSTGISCLMQTKAALSSAQSLHLSSPPPIARRVLEITGLSSMVIDEMP